MCFNKEKIENAKKEQLIEEYNNSVIAMRDNFVIRAQEYGFDEIPAVETMIYTLNETFKESSFLLSSYTLEEVKEILERRGKSLEEFKDRCLGRLESMRAHYPENVATIDKLCEDGMPLFIDIIDITDGWRTYAFCYEFKKTDEMGVYDAFILTGTRKDPSREKIYAATHNIQPMTEDEFENHYIMSRLEWNTDLHTETDIVNYDNEIRRLFNGQQH